MGNPVTTAITRIGVALICLAAFISSAGVASAQDVVITTSGDRLVGEIKRVEKDVLTLSTDYSDVDFKIEWGRSPPLKASGNSSWRPSTESACRARWRWVRTRSRSC